MKQNSTIQVVASGRGGRSIYQGAQTGRISPTANSGNIVRVEDPIHKDSPHVLVGRQGWMPVSKGRSVRQVAHDIIREGIMKLPIIVVDKAPWRGKLSSKIVVC